MMMIAMMTPYVLTILDRFRVPVILVILETAQLALVIILKKGIKIKRVVFNQFYYIDK